VTQQAVGYEDADIRLESGRLRVRRWGAAEAPAVVCVPGLSANLCGFDRLAERLAGGTLLQLVAIDLRGRGRSEVTGAGTYGWRNRARDVLGVADAVGAPSFAIIGQSSGAAIAMTCAQLEPTSATTWPTAAGRASSPVGEHPAPHAVPRVADRDKPDRALAARMAAEVVPWNPPVRRSPCCARQDQRMSTLIWG
jgi:pimeloyl-ACP methyl ester carboxylesterase